MSITVPGDTPNSDGPAGEEIGQCVACGQALAGRWADPLCHWCRNGHEIMVANDTIPDILHEFRGEL